MCNVGILSFFFFSYLSLQSTIRCEAPCYEVHKIAVKVTNPYPRDGQFKVILVENQAEFSTDAIMPSAPTKKMPEKKPPRRTRSKLNLGKQKSKEEIQPEDAVDANQESNGKCRTYDFSMFYHIMSSWAIRCGYYVVVLSSPSSISVYFLLDFTS